YRNVTGVQTCALPIFGLAREIGAPARQVFAGLGLAERRVPRALLELAVHVLHEERHPAGAGFHEADAQPLELLEEAAVDRADHEIGRASCREGVGIE